MKINSGLEKKFSILIVNQSSKVLIVYKKYSSSHSLFQFFGTSYL